MSQYATNDATPTTIINSISGNIDVIYRQNVGIYTLGLSDDNLVEGRTSAWGTSIGNSVLSNIVCKYADVNSISIEIFDNNNNHVDLNGEALIGIYVE